MSSLLNSVTVIWTFMKRRTALAVKVKKCNKCRCSCVCPHNRTSSEYYVVSKLTERSERLHCKSG